MTQYNLPQDVVDYIQGLEKRIEKLEKLVQVGNTSIDNGALLVKKGNQVVAAFGDLSAVYGGGGFKRPDGTPQMGTVLYRDNGQIAFAIWDDSPLAPPGYQQYWAWFDRSGRVVFSDDTDSGWGLATPYIPSGVWINNDTTQWPAQTSATFTPAWDSYYRVQHNKLYVDFLMYVDAGTTGEARLTIEGTQYGPTISAAGVGYGNFAQVLDVPQALHQNGYVHLSIEQRRVSGAGNVRVSPRIAYGRQT